MSRVAAGDTSGAPERAEEAQAIGQRARSAARQLPAVSTHDKNAALRAMGAGLRSGAENRCRSDPRARRHSTEA